MDGPPCCLGGDPFPVLRLCSLSLFGSPRSPSSSPAQKESGAGARSTAGWLSLPTRPPGCSPPLGYPPVPKAAARSTPLPRPRRTRAPDPALTGELSALPQTPSPASGLALQSPTAATRSVLCSRAGPACHRPWAPAVPPPGSLTPPGCPSFTHALPCSARRERDRKGSPA